jgi:hypothetical protein
MYANLTDGAGQQVAGLIEDLRRDSQRLDELYNGLMQETLWSTVAEASALATAAPTWPRLALELESAFQDFAWQSWDSLGSGSPVFARALVRATREDVHRPLVRSLQATAALFPVPKGSDADIQSVPNVYAELLPSTKGPAPLEFAVAEERAREVVEPASMVVGLAGDLIGLVCRINKECEVRSAAHVFKYTTKSYQAAGVIHTVAVDEVSFFHVVDHLYFLLYEGSGDAQRLVAVVAAEELTGLWDLKHLRREARHDLDHGANDKAQKALRRIGEIHQSLIGKPLPRSRSDYASAQIALYKRLLAMLEEVAAALAARRHSPLLPEDRESGPQGA